MWIDESGMHPLQPLLLFKGFQDPKTDNAVVKLLVSFIYLFCFKMKRKLWKKAFFQFRQETMALVRPFGLGILYKIGIWKQQTIKAGNIASETLAKIKWQN